MQQTVRVVSHVQDEFDDDPEMYLANILWGVPFQLAMVQTTEYNGSYNLDVVYSRSFALPDPYWRSFAEEVLEDQNVINCREVLSRGSADQS